MNNKKTNKYIVMVCLVSVLSQIPYIYNNNILNKMVSVSWFMFAGLLLVNNGYTIYKSKILLIPIIFDFYCLITETITGNNYMGSNLFRPVNLCTFVFIVGILVSELFDFKSLNTMASSLNISILSGNSLLFSINSSLFFVNSPLLFSSILEDFSTLSNSK